MCSQRKGVTTGCGFDTLSFLGWTSSTTRHTSGGPLHASSPVLTVLRRCDLGNITLGCHSHPPCVCPGGGRPVPSTVHATPIVTTNKQVRAPTMTSGPPVPSKGRDRRCGRGRVLIGGVGEPARPEKGVLGLHGNVMGDCVTAVRPHSCRQAHHRAC